MAEEATSYKKNYFTPRNILIYVVVGILVYAAVYFLFLRGNSESSLYQAGTEPVTESTENVMEVTLNAQNDSGQDGTATLSEENGMAKVVINVANPPQDVEQPAHIHVGACPTPGDVSYPLTNVVNGTSETVLDVDLATLRGQLPLAINVHKSGEEVDVYVACGDLQ